MKKIHLGYVQGTHGLRGDLKIKNISNDADKIYIKGKKIYLNNEVHTISDIKVYKGNYLMKIDGLNHINLVEHYKGYDLYIDRDEIGLDNEEYLLEDLIGMKVISNNKEYGIVNGITSNGVYNMIEVKYNDKVYLVPLIDVYLDKVDLLDNKVYINDVEGLIL